MRLIADYHTHTRFSHGKGSITDNVEEAIKKGLSAVGITDHSSAHFIYGLKKAQVGHYISCIEDAKREFGGRIDVKTGIELDLIGIDGSVDIPPGFRFDIVILGYHKAAVCKDIRSAWTFLTGSSFGHAISITRAYMTAIQKNHIDIVSHPGYGVSVDYGMLGKACADYGTLFEINNRHMGLTVENISEAAIAGAKFIISSDAHAPQDVGNVSAALSLAAAAGLGAGQVVNLEPPKS